MSFYLWFTTAKYEPEMLSEFARFEELLAFVNERADNDEFKFRVVEGRDVPLKAVSVATKYVRG